jgi:hypothetical protein
MTTTQVRNDSLLRFAIKLDAIASGGLGVLGLALGAAFGPELGLPVPFVLGISAFFVAFGVGVYLIGTRPVVNRTFVGVLVLGNLLWVVDSVLVAEGFFFPTITTVGTVVVLAQALAVAGFVTLEVLGLRRAA